MAGGNVSGSIAEGGFRYERGFVPIPGDAVRPVQVLCGMRWSRCLVYLDDMISFGRSIPEALARLEEVLGCLSDFGLQLKVKKCTFMQTEVIFLGHILGRTGLACDPAKLSVVRNWHAPDKVKAVRLFVGFVGYYRRFVKDFAELVEPLVALTWKGAPFV